MYEFRLTLHGSLFLGVKHSGIGSDNDLAPTTRQAIIWTNDVQYTLLPNGWPFFYGFYGSCIIPQSLTRVYWVWINSTPQLDNSHSHTYCRTDAAINKIRKNKILKISFYQQKRAQNHNRKIHHRSHLFEWSMLDTTCSLKRCVLFLLYLTVLCSRTLFTHILQGCFIGYAATTTNGVNPTKVTS